MSFSLPPEPGPGLMWNRKAILRDLVACTGMRVPEIAAVFEIPLHTMTALHSERNLLRPKDDIIGKVLGLVSRHVDAVIQIGRALEAENPLSEAEFAKAFALEAHFAAIDAIGEDTKARVRIPGRIGYMSMIHVAGDDWKETKRNAIAGTDVAYREYYRRLIRDPFPVVIDGEPLSTEQRARRKRLLSWVMRGLNLQRQELASRVGLQKVSIDSWLGAGYPVSPNELVLNGLIRVYLKWAIDAQEEIRIGRIDITRPSLPVDWEYEVETGDFEAELDPPVPQIMADKLLRKKAK